MGCIEIKEYVLAGYKIVSLIETWDVLKSWNVLKIMHTITGLIETWDVLKLSITIQGRNSYSCLIETWDVLKLASSALFAISSRFNRNMGCIEIKGAWC